MLIICKIKSRYTFLLGVVFVVFCLPLLASAQTVENFYVADNASSPWTAPANVYSVTVECWGGGGGGAGDGNTAGNGVGGGGGGAYARTQVSVTPFSTYSFSVGAGGAGGSGGGGGDGAAGSDTSFNTSACVADGGGGGLTTGGAGGAGGTVANSTGDVKYAGGAGDTPATTAGGGGGASADSDGTGVTATTQTGAVANTDGGDGADGGSAGGNGVAVVEGTDGYGGGGGGSGNRSGGAEAGGDGGDGRLRLTYSTTIDLGGTVYTDAGNSTTSDSFTVKVAVGTSTPATVYSTTTDSNGNYTFTFDAATAGITSETPLVFWVDNSPTTTATTFIRPNGLAPITDADLWGSHAIIRHEGATTTSIADLAFYDNSNDSDILYTATTTGTDSMTVLGTSTTLYVWGGDTFAPAGNVTVQGSLLGGTAASYTGSTTAFTLTFTGTSTSLTVGPLSGNVGDVVFNGSGGEWDLSTFGAQDFTITNGTVTLQLGELSVGDDFTNNGTFTNPGGMLTSSGTADHTISGTLTGTSNLGSVTIGGGASTTFANNASTTDLTIINGGQITAPAQLTVEGRFSQNGTLVNNGGTIYFTDYGSVIEGNLNGSSGFSTVVIDGINKTFATSTEVVDLVIKDRLDDFAIGTGVFDSTVKIADGINGGPTGLDTYDYFGTTIANIGDLDGDGVVDLAVGAPGDESSGGSDGEGAVHILFMNSDGTVDSTVKIAKGENGGPSGLEGGDNLGSAIANIGDLNGDGVVDLAVGAHSDEATVGGDLSEGAVHILFMNSDGTVNSTIKIAEGENGGPSGLDSSDNFGTAIANIGDLDGDGVTDLAVGATRDEATSGGESAEGAVHILFMNSDGTVNSTVKISDGENGGPSIEGGDNFGSAIASIGDLDGDGVTDLAVGAEIDEATTGGDSAEGAVHILFMNNDGSVSTSTKISDDENGGPSGLATNQELGTSVANIGDLNGDGNVDVAVGAAGFVPDDIVFIFFLNSDGTVAEISRTNSSIEAAGSFGSAIANIGDLNGDGVIDLAIGAYSDEAVETVDEREGTVFVAFMASSTASTSLSVATALEVAGSMTVDGVFDSQTSEASLTLSGTNETVSGTGTTSVYSLTNTGSTTISIDIDINGDYNNSGTIDYSGTTFTVSKKYQQLSDIIYSSEAEDVSAEDVIPRFAGFNADGSKMYVAGANTDAVYEYDLATNYDVSSATVVSAGDLDVTSETGVNSGQALFGNAGNKLYVNDSFNDNVYAYDLSTAYDVSTGAYNSESLSVSGVVGNPAGMAFDSGGTKLFIADSTSDDVYAYELSIAWDVSSGSHEGEILDTGSGQSILITNLSGVAFNGDGTILYVADPDEGKLVRYDLSTAWDVSTGSSVDSVDISAQDGAPLGLAFNSDFSKIYFGGNDTDSVYGYDFDLTWQTFSGELSGDSSLPELNFLAENKTVIASTTKVVGLTLAEAADVTLATSTTITGDITNNGILRFVDSGTTTFAGTSLQTATGSMTGLSELNNVVITNTSGTDASSTPGVIFGATASSTGNLSIDTPGVMVQFQAGATTTWQDVNVAGDAGDYIYMYSNNADTQYNIDVVGTTSANYVYFKDANACASQSGNISTTNSVSSDGNNTCIDSLGAAENLSTVVWDGGGGNSSWETATNWSTDVVPTASDDVVIDTAVTVNIAASTTINSLSLGSSTASVASILNFNYDAEEVDPLTITNDFTIYNGASLTHGENATTQAYTIDLEVGGDMDLQSGATIDLDVNGFKGGASTGSGSGPGAGTGVSNYGPGGGAYGGDGGDGSVGSSGSAYGSTTNPVQLGSGGGGGLGTTGGDAGGLARITVVGTTTIDGTITADGAQGSIDGTNGRTGASGSGGGVYINTGTLAGSGSIGANGAAAAENGIVPNYHGAGGGGRVAIHYTSGTSSGLTLQAFGGTNVDSTSRRGAAGTVYIKGPSNAHGNLLIDNNSLTTVSVYTPFSADLTSISFDDVTIAGAALSTAPSGNLTIHGDYNNAATVDFSSNGTTTFAGTAAQTVSGTLTGASAFSNLVISNTASTTFSNNLAATDVLIESGSELVAPTELTLTGDFTNNGTFSHNSGLVYFSGTATQTATGTLDGTSAFNTLTVTNTSGDGTTTASVLFGSNITTAGTMTMDASSSAQFTAGATSTFQNVDWQGGLTSPIYLNSTEAGEPWYLDIPGTRINISRIQVQDSDASGTTLVTAENSTDWGNNTNWDFIINNDIVWDGGGGNSNWETADNWTGDVLPTDENDVIIDTAVTVNIAAATTINSLSLGSSTASVASVLNFNYNAVAGSPLVVDDGDVTVYNGASIDHTNGTASVVGTIDIEVQTGDFTVASGASINLTGAGFNATGEGNGAGPGGGSDGGSAINPGSGGAYGGNAGISSVGTAGGSAYGSTTYPVQMGSEGGHGDAPFNAGTGGGLVLLDVAGTTTIDGSIVANGTNGGVADFRGGGGGSGGGINITTGILEGSGTVTVNGGNGGDDSNGDGGGGSGGRIAIAYDSGTTTNLTLQSRGGTGPGAARAGAAGTIYLNGPDNTFGDLIINNNSLADVITTTPMAADVSSVSFNDVTLVGTSLVTAPSVSLTIYGDYSNSSTFNANSGLVTFNGSTPQTVSGTLTGSSAFNDMTIVGTTEVTFAAAATSLGTTTITTTGTTTFNAGSTYTFQNIDWQGTATTSETILRSSAPASAWYLDVPGVQTTVAFVNVQDSDATLTSGGVVAATSTNAGNNTNWDFGVVAGTGSTTIANHDATQVSNAFNFQNQTNEALFAFKLIPESGNATVTELTLDISGVKKVVAADFTNIKLLRDYDNDAAYDAGDAEVSTGVMSLTSGFNNNLAGTITFSTDFLSTTTQNYVVVADWDAPDRGSFLTIVLTQSGVTSVDEGGTQDIYGTVDSIQHNRAESRGGGGGSAAAIGEAAPAGDGDVGGGGAGGGGEIDTNTGGGLIGNAPDFNWPSANSGSWNSADNAYDQVDGTYATTSSTDTNQFTNYTHGVPGTDEIVGIAVKLELSGTTAAGDIDVELSWDGGTSWTSAKTTPTLTTTDTVVTLGGASDLWGRSAGAWVPSHFSNANFSLRLTGNPSSNEIRVDALQVKVFHQATGGGGGGGGGAI